MTLFKHVPIFAALTLTMASIHVHAGEDEAMMHRDQALRQQNSRVQELMLNRTTASVSAPSLNGTASRSLTMQRGVSSAAVTQSATTNGVGVIKLSDKPTTNQLLRQGMNTARTSLKGIKDAHNNIAEQEQQRSQAEVGLEQAVQAYLASRAEAKVPIRSHYEHDAFLREMITIKQALTQKTLDAAAVNGMLDHLAVARTILVTLTESTQ